MAEQTDKHLIDGVTRALSLDPMKREGVEDTNRQRIEGWAEKVEKVQDTDRKQSSALVFLLMGA